MAYQMPATTMIEMIDLKGHSLVAGLFKFIEHLCSILHDVN